MTTGHWETETGNSQVRGQELKKGKSQAKAETELDSSGCDSQKPTSQAVLYASEYMSS